MGNPHKTENPPQMENGSVEVLGTVSIQNQGCKLNQADSEALARRFVQAGYRVVGPSEPADIHIINTCTVTHVADSKARQALRTAHRENPSALVVATGCYCSAGAERACQGRGSRPGGGQLGEGPPGRDGTGGSGRSASSMCRWRRPPTFFYLEQRARSLERLGCPETKSDVQGKRLWPQ